MLLGLFLVAAWAGTQNALAGGGSFVTLPALMLSGLDARAANIASTLALFPGQCATGWVGRKMVSGVNGLSFKALSLISLAGGAVGAVLLLSTPSPFFARLVPWLVLMATGLFAYGSFGPRRHAAEGGLDPRLAGGIQFLIAIYGGYFGGGIGFLMLAALTAAGLAVRTAGATKNVLASVMNAAAVAVFLFTPGVPWLRVGVVSAGAIAGGYGGALLLQKVDERLIRGFVVVLGLALTVGLFLRQPHG
ncbi:sulfite exporter TauE/SafE family protein [Phenylobacterium montanum]|uniref:Probable membrane transporter protein n=1 Tax=Phenylobacterium montanum TaxID=2823693 RepID=A0A975G1N3_9CAUL|nr:TSUP family transporter [Caulobacter sp. S6]QUD88927.1 sulfite exporter TauE/SafE family protein [Caulobacter sp. S6]